MPGRKGPNRDTYGEQFRLWVPKTQFNLVYGRAVLERIGSQVFVSVGLSRAARNTSKRTTYLHTLKLSTMSTLQLSETLVVDLLADTNISYLAFIDQFFKFLPCRVGVISQRLVDDDLPLFLIRFFLECDRPETQPLTSDMATGECSTHQ